MPKLYGELLQEDKMRVDVISYCGNRAGGIEVEEVLEGEGTHFVNPLTGEQWFESEKDNNVKLGLTLEQKIDKLLSILEGGVKGELGG